jgi:hypothetical protein
MSSRSLFCTLKPNWAVGTAPARRRLQEEAVSVGEAMKPPAARPISCIAASFMMGSDLDLAARSWALR